MDGFNISGVSDVFVGNVLAKQVYIASKKVWDYITSPVYTAPTAKAGLVYSGSAQSLLNPGSTSHGTIQYSSDGSIWGTTIPQAINAGDNIVVFWKLSGDDRHSDIAPTAIACAIAKVPPTYTAPTPNDATYTGSEITLLNAGSSSHGDFKYSTNGTTWSVSLPKGINVGTYKSYWKLDGDGNHTNVPSTEIVTTITQANGSVSISGVNIAYSGSAQNLATVSGATGTMHYRLGTSGSWLTTIPLATNHTESAYEIYWYMDASTNYKGLHSASSPAKVTSTIGKINPTIVAPTAKTGLVYTGSEQTLWNEGSNTTAGSFSYGKGTAADTYNSSWSFTPTDTTNYNTMGGSALITIAKASASINYATKSVSKTYGNAAFTNTLTKSGDGSVTYSSSNTTVATINSSGQVTINQAGSATITATVTDGDNYTYATKTTSYTLTVSTRTVTITAPTGTNRTYTGNAQTIFAVGSCTTGGTMYYSDTNKTFSTSTWTTSLPYTQKTNAGTYTVYYYCYVSDTTNNSGSGINSIKSISATISQGSRSGAVSCNNVTYGSTVQASVSVSPTSWTGGTVTWGITNGTGSATINSSGVVTPTSVGTVTVTASVAASGNYAGYTATSKQITIGQRTVTPTAPTATNRNYTGSAQTIFSGGSCTAGGTMYYSDTDKTFSTSTWSTSLPYTQKTNAGTYTIYWYCYVSDTTNNTGTNINTKKSISATINKVVATLPTTWSGDSKEYHNTASLTVSGYSGGSIKYRYDANNGTSWTETTTAPTRTSVGDTAVQCMIVGDSNHTDTAWSSTVTLSVYKASDARMTVTPSSTLTYSGSAQTIATASDAHGISTYYIGYRKDAQATADSQITWNSASTTPLLATNAGDYYIYYKFTVDSSHTGDKAYTYVGKTTINKKSRSGAVSCNNVTYGSTVTASVSGNTENGTITWGITAGTGTATISGGVVTPTKVGKVTVTASVAATANYAAYTATSKEITISQRTVTWSAPTRTNRTYNGNDLTIFAVGSCSAGGTMLYSTDNSSWSSSIPYTQKKEPGTYTIYYRCYVSDTTNNTGTNINTSYSLLAVISKISTNAPVLTAGTKTTYDGNWVYATAKNDSGNPAGTVYYGASSGSTSYSVTASSTAQNLSNMGRRDVGTTTIYAFFRPTDTAHYYDSSSASTTASVTNRATGSSGSVSNPGAQTYKTSGTYSYTIGITGATGTVTYPSSFSVNGTTWSCNTSTGVVTVPQGTNAGSYTLTGNITVAQSTNYNAVSATSKTWTITINKASQSAPTATDVTTTYHNTATGSASGGGGYGTLYYKADTNGGTSYGTAITTAPSRSAVGTTKYVAYWGGNANYNASSDSAAKSLVVNKASDASVTVTRTNRNYTGSAQTIASATSHGCTYYLGTGTSSAVSSWASASTSITATNAGTYYIWYKGTADSNHSNDVSSSYSGTVVINKIDPTITAPTGKTGLTYSGSSLTLYNNGSNTTSGSFSYTNGTRTDAGTQTVSWTFTPTDTTNYNTKTGSFDVTIARSKTASASASNKTYNGTTESNGSSQTGVTGSNVSWRGNTSGTNAGSYTAYATPTSNYAWSDGTYTEKTITWTMSRRGQTAPVLNGATATYPNTATATVKTAGTVANGTTAAPGTLTWTNQSRSSVGSQTATAYYAATATNFSASSVSSGVTVSVSKATPTVVLMATDRAYNGNALYATATVSKPSSGVVIKGTIYYGTSSGATTYSVTYSGSGSVNLSSVSQTNAGSTTVYAYFVPDSTCNSYYNNSGNASKTFTVTKAAGSISYATTSVSKKCLDRAFINPLTKVGDGTVTYRTSDSMVAQVDSSGQVDVQLPGTCTIYATVTDGTNYTYATKEASYTVSVAYRDNYIGISAYDLTYNGTNQNMFYINQTGWGGGTLYWRLGTSGTWNTVNYGDAPTVYGTNAGTYTMQYYVDGGVYYKDIASSSSPESKSCTIAQASRTVSFTRQPSLVIAGDEDGVAVSASAGGGTWSFSSSNTSVATINSMSGSITAIAAGTTTITASISALGNYAAASASYTLTVGTEQDRYLTFIAHENITNLYFNEGRYNPYNGIGAYYSLDNGATWTSTREVNTQLPRSISVPAGGSIMFKGNLGAGSNSDSKVQFIVNGKFSAKGNPMSVISMNDFRTRTTAQQYAFNSMFEGCSKLQSISSLVLPCTTLAERCYYSMFKGCTSLTTVPSNLLPATTLTTTCYGNMFEGCTSLTAAPNLPALTLTGSAYHYMFHNCSSLTYIKAMFTTKPTSRNNGNWVTGVSATGTFVKNSAATWDVTGNYGVPTGWTVTTASS